MVYVQSMKQLTLLCFVFFHYQLQPADIFSSHRCWLLKCNVSHYHTPVRCNWQIAFSGFCHLSVQWLEVSHVYWSRAGSGCYGRDPCGLFVTSFPLHITAVPSSWTQWHRYCTSDTPIIWRKKTHKNRNPVVVCKQSLRWENKSLSLLFTATKRWFMPKLFSLCVLSDIWPLSHDAEVRLAAKCFVSSYRDKKLTKKTRTSGEWS